MKLSILKEAQVYSPGQLTKLEADMQKHINTIDGPGEVVIDELHREVGDLAEYFNVAINITFDHEAYDKQNRGQ